MSEPTKGDPYRVAKDIGAGAAGGIAQVLSGQVSLQPLQQALAISSRAKTH